MKASRLFPGSQYRMLRGRFGGYSMERLFRLLLALDSDVAIVICPKRAKQAHLSVITP